MKLVVDANVVTSALVADSETRELIVTLDPDLLTPALVHDEIENYDELIVEKSGTNRTPHLPLDTPVAFNCDLFHDEWGEGQVRGTTNIPGGGIRNVLTFPPSL